MRRLRVVVHGAPVGKGRPRLGRHGHAYTPDATKKWEKHAILVLRSQARIQRWACNDPAAPVIAVVNAVQQRTKALMGKKHPGGRMVRVVKPDADNVLKAALDACEAAGVIVQDQQVSTQIVRSLWAARDEGPCVEITLVMR